MLRKPREDRQTLVGRLYDVHGAALYRYALMILADHAAAEDVVQHVFAAVMRRSEPIENEAHYLRRSVRNECYSLLRKKRDSSTGDRQILEPIASADLGAEERIALGDAIGALPSEQREVIHLHVFEGMTLREIAIATEESPNTIASRYRYAIDKLRKALTLGE
jgi:RNA polymerase sigma-70 factor (ECF subfamily)